MSAVARICGARGRGASLIEVLVAIIVLSLGLLGLAGMQANALKGMQSAQARALAALQIQDIVDRMRANRARADDGAYDLPAGEAVAEGDALAQQDLRAWKRALARDLPDGDGSIVRSASAARTEACDRAQQCFFWITVQWSALGEDGQGERGSASDAALEEAPLGARRVQRLTVVAVL